MNQVTAFQCEYCLRHVGMNKHHVRKHETTCFKNPARRACPTCKFEDRIIEERGEFVFGEYVDRTADVGRCCTNPKGDYMKITPKSHPNLQDLRVDCEGWRSKHDPQSL